MNNIEYQAMDGQYYPNEWDDGYPSGGNYWNDYTGVDFYSGANQDILGSDGIGDITYDISGSAGAQDRYPLYIAIQANVIITPETLNLASKGKFTAFITLPEPYNIADIDISTVVCEGAPAVKGMVADDNKYIAKFDREDLREDLPTGDEVEMTVTGKLFDGTPFEGSDTIRVIDKGKGK